MALFLFFLSVFLFLGFFSYSPLDPSFNNAVAKISIRNYVGIIGAFFCGSILDIFGSGGFWLPFLLIIKSILLFRNKTDFLKGTPGYIGGLILIITTGALFPSLSGFMNLPDYPLISGTLRDFLIRYLKEAGALILLVFLFLFH